MLFAAPVSTLGLVTNHCILNILDGAVPVVTTFALPSVPVAKSSHTGYIFGRFDVLVTALENSLEAAVAPKRIQPSGEIEYCVKAVPLKLNVNGNVNTPDGVSSPVLPLVVLATITVVAPVIGSKLAPVDVPKV